MRSRLPIRVKAALKRTALCLGLAGVAFGLYIALSPRPPLLEAVPFSQVYYDRNGTLLRLALAQDGRYRLFTPFKDISPDLITATLTQEDRHFFHHPGVNPVSLLRGAIETYIARSRPIGGSTITMQVVRLRDDLNTRTLTGKALQIIRAFQLERHYSKQDILEAYLNLAPYGGNIHGAGSAALIYFHQPAKNLALPQSLALAVIPQNPIKRSPLNSDITPWNEARERLFARMPETYAGYTREMQLPLSVFARTDLPFHAPHFLNGLDTTAHQVTTTLDLPLQNLLEQRIATWLERARKRDLDNASAMLIDIRTRSVVALVGSGNFFDKRTAGEVDGTLAPRSPGSTLKPFVYALALEQGLIHPETLLADDPTYFSEYRPGNFDRRFMGAIPAREALYLSRNVPAIALAARLQDPDLYTFLQDSGAGFPADRSHYGLSMVVGGAEISMRSLAKLYTMLANSGELGDLIYTAEQAPMPPVRMLSPEAALLTLTMIERSNPDILPFAKNSLLPVYWKTGTSNGFRDAWTVGIFGPYVLAVWTGHFDGRPSPALVGTEAAAPLFFDLVSTLARREKLKDIIHPALAKLNVNRLPMCPQTGDMRDCGQTRAAWFIPGKSPFALTLADKPLEILSPRSGLSYVQSRKAKDPLRIPLETTGTETNHPLFWFSDNQLIAVADTTGPLFWEPKAGTHVVRFVDSQGRSAAQKITVISGD